MQYCADNTTVLPEKKKKKSRKAIETEIDKRDEEITRADTKGAKANTSFLQKAAEVEAVLSWERTLNSVGARCVPVTLSEMLFNNQLCRTMTVEKART